MTHTQMFKDGSSHSNDSFVPVAAFLPGPWEMAARPLRPYHGFKRRFFHSLSLVCPEGKEKLWQGVAKTKNRSA